MDQQLKVKQIETRNAGRGIAKISQDVFSTLGLSEGDYIALGRESTVIVQAFPAEDPDLTQSIKIDGDIRGRAEVNLNDDVSIRSADVTPAESVSVKIPSNVAIEGDISVYLKNELHHRAVAVGHAIPVSFSLSKTERIKIEVADMSPDVKAAFITDDTEVSVEKVRPEFIDSRPVADESSSGVTYEDLGGVSDELETVREMIEIPMRYPELFRQLGIDPPSGVLMEGPPGTGKTLIARAVANEIDAHFIDIQGPEILSSQYAGSVEQLRDLFDEAKENAPSIIFIDEIDAIAGERDEDSHEATDRVVNQLLTLMDGVDDLAEDIVVMAATNRVDALDNALRRGGRFDREIKVGVPDKKGRREILDVHTREMPVEPTVNLDEYAEQMQGFVGADIASFAQEAAMNALRRITGKGDFDLTRDTIDAATLTRLRVGGEDFRHALTEVEPSAMREVATEVPSVSWEDIGGLEDTKDAVREMIQWPMEQPEAFEIMGVDSPTGILLYGPPGTGKTMLAKAVANETNTNFISVKGPELMNKWVGESEEAVREIFSKARENAPTVIFFDEFDAIAGERDGGSSNEVKERVVTQLLTELDGLESLENVTVVGATNRPDVIDDALMRSGRFDRHIYVPIPDKEARRKILEVQTSGKPMSEDVDLETVAEQAEGYVGSDIEAVCREAAMLAMRDYRDGGIVDLEVLRDQGKIELKHFVEALDTVSPSVTKEKKEQYEQIEAELEDDNTDNNRLNRREGGTGFQ